MKRYLWFVLFLLAFALNLNAQNDSIITVTKYNTLDTRKGTVIRFVDKKMKDIVYTNMFPMNSKIRTFYDTGEKTYFVILSLTKSKTMIEYSDLVEVNKAFDKFFKEVDEDCALKPDYLENKFITDDGFKIGYYVEKGKAHWFVDFDTTSLFMAPFELKKPYDFANGLKDLQNEIEIMKNGK